MQFVSGDAFEQLGVPARPPAGSSRRRTINGPVRILWRFSATRSGCSGLAAIRRLWGAGSCGTTPEGGSVNSKSLESPNHASAAVEPGYATDVAVPCT